MQLCHGSYKSVLLIGPLAIKFPRLEFFWWLVKELPHGMRRISHVWDFIFYSYQEIRDECLTWARFKSDYLAQVYFFFGPVMVQKRIDGSIPSEEEGLKIWADLYHGTGHEVFKANAHNLSNRYSYRKTDKGFVLIDYGSNKEIAMRDLLLTWDFLFKQVLLGQAPPLH
jgi:hypothetical protein